jgi:hypothetical protein
MLIFELYLKFLQEVLMQEIYSDRQYYELVKKNSPNIEVEEYNEVRIKQLRTLNNYIISNTFDSFLAFLNTLNIQIIEELLALRTCLIGELNNNLLYGYSIRRKVRNNFYNTHAIEMYWTKLKGIITPAIKYS